MPRQWQEGELGGVALIAGGFILVTMTIGGYVIGGYIGRYLGAQQNGAITGLILGAIVGFWDLYRIAIRVMRRQPIPTAAQQKAAAQHWEDDDKKDFTEDEGLRDKNHE